MSLEIGLLLLHAVSTSWTTSEVSVYFSTVLELEKRMATMHRTDGRWRRFQRWSLSVATKTWVSIWCFLTVGVRLLRMPICTVMWCFLGWHLHYFPKSQMRCVVLLAYPEV